MFNLKLPRPFDAYKGHEPYIFVSYAQQDAGLVYPELKFLKNLGFRIRYDEGFDSGSKQTEETALAIQKCAFFIVFITPDSVKSKKVVDEIHFAIDNNIKFLAIHLIETTLPVGLQLRIGSLQAIFKYNHTEETYIRKITGVLPEKALEANPEEMPVKAVDQPNPQKPLLRWGFIGGGVLIVVLLSAWVVVNYFGTKSQAASASAPGSGAALISTPSSTPAVATDEVATLTPISSITPESTATEIVSTPMPLSMTWSRINTGQFAARDSITAIAIDPKDASVIYAGTRFAGLYKSMDSGSSWQPLHGGVLSQQIQALVIDPNNHLVIYAVTNGGVYKSQDGGSSWITQNKDLPDNFTGGTSKIILDSQNNQNLTLAYASGVYQSGDGGSTWQARYQSSCPTINGSLSIEPSSPNTWYINQIGQNDSCKNGIYQTVDGGKTWALKNDKAFGSGLYNLFQIEKTTDNHVYLYSISVDRTLWVSQDGGNSWHNSNIPQCASLNSDTKGNTLAVCAGKVYRFTAGKLQLEMGNIPASSFQVSIAPSDPKKIVLYATNGDQISNSGNFYISSDGGLNYQERTSGIGMTCQRLNINPFDPGAMYLVSNCETAGGGYYSTDNGTSWQKYHQFQGETGVIFHNLDFDADGKIMYATSYFGKWLWSTLVRADNWIGKMGPFESRTSANDYRFAADPFVPSKLYFIGNNLQKKPVLIASTDRGVSWDAEHLISLPLDQPLKDGEVYFDHDQGNQVYLVDSGQAVKSMDHGKTWAKCGAIPSTGSSQILLAVDLKNSQQIYLGTQGQGVLISADGCQTWIPSNTGLSYPYINSLVVNPSNVDMIYAGTDDGIFVSLDKGKTWRDLNEGLLNNPIIFSMAVDAKNNILYATTPYGLFKLVKK